jgi:hypothetical protein
VLQHNRIIIRMLFVVTLFQHKVECLCSDVDAQFIIAHNVLVATSGSKNNC